MPTHPPPHTPLMQHPHPKNKTEMWVFENIIIRPATKLSDREVVLDDRELEIYLQIQEVATDVCV